MRCDAKQSKVKEHTHVPIRDRHYLKRTLQPTITAMRVAATVTSWRLGIGKMNGRTIEEVR